MTIGLFRSTQRVVDCQAIFDNIAEEKNRLTDGTEIFAVVKANGYGHGAIKVAEVARSAGATGFCVALLEEALELREAGFIESILVMGYIDPKYAGLFAQERISATATSLEWLIAASKTVLEENCQNLLMVHVKIDTGMGRLGIVSETEMIEVVGFLDAHTEIELEGLYTHFAKADSQDDHYLQLQQKRFKKAIELFPKDIAYIHTANSATALWHQHWQSNMVRLGVSMYGLNPSGKELQPPYPLKQAMSLVTTLVHVKELKKGEHISYGADYETQDDEWIGTLPIGYADGLIRKFTGFEVLVDGQKVPIVGRICMDQCMIHLPKKYPVGTKVTIFGLDGEVLSSIQAGAEYVDTINYEIPCIISERVPIVYVNEKLEN